MSTEPVAESSAAFNAAKIPNRLVFIWIGEALPTTAVIAIRSAWLHCQPDEIVLLHEGLTPRSAGVADVAELPGVRLQAASAADFDLDCDPSGAVRRQFETLKSPASRANLLRLAYLYRHGGVYLDTDTITIRDLAPLRQQAGFCGVEPVLHPYRSKRPSAVVALGRKLSLGIRGLVREACARIPGGVALHRVVDAPTQELAVNNAVIGACVGNPTLAACITRIGELPEAERAVRFRLGTHLMQEITRNTTSATMTVYPAEYFYPLGPVLSLQYFRAGSEAALSGWLSRDTHVVHWYSSLEASIGGGPLDATWIEGHPDTAFSALARPHLPARRDEARRDPESGDARDVAAGIDSAPR